MKIIDAHCDALYKMQIAARGLYQQKENLSFENADALATNLSRLKTGNIAVQFFAIFVDPDLPAEEMWQHALEQANLFHQEIIEKHNEVKQIRKWQDIKTLKPGEIGAVLTLEGAEPIGNDLHKLAILYRLGVKSIGLTWNPANLCADGAEEPRGAGLTRLGKEVVSLNNSNQVWTDVSHLSVRAFWDVVELSDYPIASHSNARTICDHPRNLYDNQIQALIEKGAPIHFALYPLFLKRDAKTATVADLCKHIDHVCALGGEKHIGFGSDFDGIDYFIEGVTDSSCYGHLINELQKHYSETQVRRFAYQNFIDLLPTS